MNEIFELDLSVRPLNDMFVFMYEGFVDGARIDKEELKIADLDELGDIMTEDPKVLINCYKAFYEDMKNMSPKNEESKKK